ncbi:MAG: gamma-glutamyl-gamma-aminobutyrate hydrolase family protein [Solirubrobacteraceae bacterium]
MSFPRVGICTALERASWSMWEQKAALLGSSYVEAVQAGGGLALMLPPDARLAEDPSQALDAIDGLMLAGGADIDPAGYGAQRHPATQQGSPERDAFEIALVRGAIQRDLPVLGICRGMQLINVALGGTLHQHLPHLLRHQRHLRRPGTFDDSDHEVRPVEGTLAARVAGQRIHIAKSHHHQGIDRLGDGLLAGATSPFDGLIEAIELPHRGFVLGVQWHPEADPASPVVGAFVEACRRGSQAPRAAPARRFARA